MPTVLITGFGPFPGAPINPTEPLVRRLVASRASGLAGVKRVAHLFRTSYAATKALRPLLARHRPDVLLMFGLAQGTPHLRIERRARNSVTMLADVDDHIWHGAGIRPGGLASITGRAPFAKLLIAALGASVPVRFSDDAGGYICNFLYWQALEATRRGRPPLVVFVHVPLVGRRHPMTAARLERAGTAILRALCVAARRRR
jgi:pyroglutamyl-peptidase